MAAAASAPALQVVSVGGQSIPVDVEGVATVAQLRSRLAATLSAPTGSVKLLSGGSLLEDTASPAGLITVLLSSPGPSWYPGCKYMHNGNEVLKVTWGVDHNRGHETHYSKVVYTDGTSLDKCDEGQAWRGGVEDWEVCGRLEKISKDAKKLAQDLGFVTHTVMSYSDQPCFQEDFEAVPPEDPDEWEKWDDGYCGRGERRKPTLEISGVEATAQQADGKPGVAFRMGSKDSEPLLDIPNGTRVQCLAEDGQWLVVAFQSKVGFVKQRNLAAAACTPLALLEKVVAAQADGHRSVAFYRGQLKKEPDADIPNGTELPLLCRAGDYAVVHCNDTLGFVKQRNVDAVPQS